jgi:dihydrodipicolinate synthase/N-acetylneuraminate lyase
MFMSYNPMRSNSEIDVKSIIKLATEGTIQGIIIESGELGFFTELLEHRPENFQVFTTDRLMYSLMRLGADGVVSSIANFDYQRIENILTALVTGNLSEAKMMQNELELIAATMLHAPPPTVLKTVMSMLDSRYEECFRPPLCALDKSLKPIIQGMLKHCKL